MGPFKKYLTAYKHNPHKLEERHRQVKETQKQMEQQQLMEKTSHKETRLHLKNKRSDQNETQRGLEGRADLWRT